uniref:Zinc finger PHD-type domain-containing protein n=1 Tax=Kalanchoe fedtschenkoi TaxID=63787 RepID=A0A7N0V0W8_KALFE
MDELFDNVCSFCDGGGELLCCDGWCLRSFHPTKEAGIATGCESLGFLSDAQALSGFQCQNCRDQRYQCFVCGLLGSSDASSGAEVFPCISATCGHFYHPACVAKLIHSEDTTKVADLQNQIAKGESFTCPAHICSLCKKVEDKTIHELQSICRRCPKAYHRKCIPKGITFQRPGVSPTRAWEGLQKNRALMYCMKHKFDPELKIPKWNHILFSDTQRSEDTKRERLLSRRMEDSKRDVIGSSTRTLPQNSGSNMPKQVNLLSKRAVKSTLPKAHCSSMDAKRHLSGSSDPVEQPLKGNIKPLNNQIGEIGKTRINNPEMICASSSWSNKAATEGRIAALKKMSDASFNEKKFRSKISAVSTHSSNPTKMLDKTIPHERVEASVKAVRAALQKLEEEVTLEQAKAVCEPQILNQIMIWKRKLGVCLAPFLHSMPDTSNGRHFTKFENLQEPRREANVKCNSGAPTISKHITGRKRRTKRINKVFNRNCKMHPEVLELIKLRIAR